MAIRTIALFTLLVALCPAIVAADETPEQNAAPMIMSIWDASRKEYPRSGAISEESEGVELDEWSIGPEILTEFLNDERMTRIERIVDVEACDFGLDYSQGPNLTLPHLNPTRTAARLLLAKARFHIDAAEYADATEALRGCFVFIRHLGSDRFVLTIMVRAELSRIASILVLRMMAEDPPELDTHLLLQEIDRMPAGDRFGLRQALIFETESFSDWVIRKCATAEGRDEFWDFLDSIANVDGSDPVPSRWKLGLLVEQFGGLEASGKAFRDVGVLQAETLDLEDPIPELQRISERVDPGEFGPLAPYFVSNIDRAVLRVREAEAWLDVVQLILDEDAHQED